MKGLPKILIPTTAGTGSEVTNIAVLSLDSTKDVVTHDNLLADVAIIDPKLTLTVPPKVTAATGIDALTHAVEAYISINASPTTDALALHAIKLIAGSIRTAVRDGSDRHARIDMSYGSYIAGLAFFNAGVAGVHALAYPLGGQLMPEGLEEAANPEFETGSKVTIKADHMKGMDGAEGMVTGAYDTTAYVVDYKPTDGGEEVKDHKWVIQEEIKDAGDVGRLNIRLSEEVSHVRESR